MKDCASRFERQLDRGVGKLCPWSVRGKWEAEIHGGFEGRMCEGDLLGKQTNRFIRVEMSLAIFDITYDHTTYTSKLDPDLMPSTCK